MSEGFEKDAEASRWHYKPSQPLALNPTFKWPLSPKAILQWYASYLLAASTTTLSVILAVVVFFLLLPPLAVMHEFSMDWVLRV